MLTRDLLVHRLKDGRVTPTFQDPKSTKKREQAAELIQIVAAGIGAERAAVEEQLQSAIAGQRGVKFLRGLVKLLLDRVVFEEPAPEVADQRWSYFERAQSVYEALRDQSAPDLSDLDSAMADRSGIPLEDVRASLYRDLPGRRRAVEFETLTPEALIHRYNLAQVQGLLMSAETLTIEAHHPQTAETRKVLRWLRFCRLVCEFERSAQNLVLHVQGPAKLHASTKKYGLQLAQFFPIVPCFSAWRLRAEVKLGRGAPAMLHLNESAGLVSPYQSGLGHVPPEVQILCEKLEQSGWTVDLSPAPRHIGAKDMCVPDFAISTPGSAPIAVELFHRWHRTALDRRIGLLNEHRDPRIIFGVDRKLKFDPGDHPQFFLFTDFPTPSPLTKAARRCITPADQADT